MPDTSSGLYEIQNGVFEQVYRFRGDIIRSEVGFVQWRACDGLCVSERVHKLHRTLVQCCVYACVVGVCNGFGRSHYNICHTCIDPGIPYKNTFVRELVPKTRFLKKDVCVSGCVCVSMCAWTHKVLILEC